jgi:hypothetical protein
MPGVTEDRCTIQTCGDTKTRRLLKRKREFRSNGAHSVSTTHIPFQQRRFRSNNADFVSTTLIPFQQREICFKNVRPSYETMQRSIAIQGVQYGEYIARST